MTNAPSRPMSSTAEPASGAEAATRSATARALATLAPFIVVAALAYPALVWPLFEAELVSLGPVYGQPTVDKPPGPLLRIYFSTLFLLGMLVFMCQPGRRFSRLMQAPILLTVVYLTWAGVTGLWGVDPDVTMRRTFLALFISGSIITGTLAATDIDRMLRLAFWMFCVVIAMCAFMVLTRPPTELGHAAIYPHKNYFGAITAITSIIAMYQVGNGTKWSRPAAIAVLLCCVWFLLEARSKTSLAFAFMAPVIGFGTAFLARYGRVSPALTLAGVAVATYLVYATGHAAQLWDFHDFAATIFGDPTLTQRTDIWAFAVKMIEQRPWLGHGYEAFWGASLDSPSVREGPGFVAQMPHAHNGYIDLVLQTGYVGLGLFLLLLFTTLHFCGRVATRSLGLATFILSALVFCILYNFLETTWFRSFSLKAMIFILATAIAARTPDDSRASA
jgi:exopolysaccharide production protein ExoQ